jgi:hypothetical protein
MIKTKDLVSKPNLIRILKKWKKSYNQHQISFWNLDNIVQKPQGLNSNFFFSTYGWGSCILPSIQLYHGGQHFQAFLIFFIAHWGVIAK